MDSQISANTICVMNLKKNKDVGESRLALIADVRGRDCIMLLDWYLGNSLELGPMSMYLHKQYHLYCSYRLWLFETGIINGILNSK